MTDLTLDNIAPSMRLRLHLPPLFAVFFLTFYARVVCPFIDELSLSRVLLGLAAVWLFHALFRTWLLRAFPIPRHGRSAARHGYYLSIFGWVAAGFVAMLLHAALYPDFPIESHLKLLTGYWALGGGILAQLEYLALEEHFRQKQAEGAGDLVERITRRLMEGYALFTLVPGVVMVMIAFRFVFEGYSLPGAAYEVLFLVIVFTASALVIAFRYGRALKRDCDNIVAALESVGAGRFDVTVDAGRPDELGRVAEGINRMAGGLVLRERIREAFGRFVSPQVAEGVIAQFSEGDGRLKLGGERREVAILVVDVRNFTPLSEALEPEAVTELLNGYFGEMVAAIDEHGGMVDKFMGDAVMAVFGLSDDAADPAGQAVAAGLAMRVRLVKFNQRQRALGGKELENGIGIHVGPVVAGYMGSPERLEFTVMGHTVNIAARIEGVARGENPALLMSEEVARRVAATYTVEAIGRMGLKGVKGEIKLFTVKE